MTTKHTPGPWTIIGNTPPYAIYHQYINEEDNPDDIEIVPRVYDKDNARLIENAPDLLETLETICKHANDAWAALDHDYHEVLAGNLGDAVDQARAVIAKAKGEAK